LALLKKRILLTRFNKGDSSVLQEIYDMYRTDNIILFLTVECRDFGLKTRFSLLVKELHDYILLILFCNNQSCPALLKL